MPLIPAYELIPDAIEVTEDLIAKVRVRPIFNPDGKRTQGTFSDPVLDTRAREIAVRWGVSGVVRDVVLHSAAGCKRQQLHTDYDPEKPAARRRANVLFGIIPSTVINLSADERVEIPVGAAFLFRGDTVHAGSAYLTPYQLGYAQ